MEPESDSYAEKIMKRGRKRNKYRNESDRGRKL